MDPDLEIISEEGDSRDPLFDSIMNAMHSMKEATADMIYRKIQKEGAKKYSIPQVDKALENALKYGIFEVQNNRYRVRDDVLDDEDTVYGKYKKKRDPTPFRIEDKIDERQGGPKLNPEKDNQRFRKPSECVHCGRSRLPKAEECKIEETKLRRRRHAKRGKSVAKRNKRRRNKTKSRNRSRSTRTLKRKAPRKAQDMETTRKKRKLNEVKEENGYSRNIVKAQKDYFDDEKILESIRKGLMDPQDSESDLSDGEIEFLSASIPDSQNPKLEKMSDHPPPKSTNFTMKNVEVTEQKVSHLSPTRSDKSCISCTSSNDQCQTKGDDCYSGSCNNSGNVTEKLGDEYLTSTDTYRSQYKRGQMENEGNAEWLGCSDEQQGAIIQANNVLTIEPMDSLAFPERASYIS